MNSGSTPPASMSWLERPPTCIRVRYSVQATGTYANVSAVRPVVSSAWSTPAVGGLRPRSGPGLLDASASASTGSGATPVPAGAAAAESVTGSVTAGSRAPAPGGTGLSSAVLVFSLSTAA
ncbi:MAG: hypothetical protein ACRDTA_10195 [Pseudonocardiaceae bacterium]